MAKRAKKNEKVEESRGPCSVCEGPVDMVVEPWQVNSDDTFKCVNCRIKAINNAASKKVETLIGKVNKVREGRHLPLFEMEDAA